MTTFHAWQPWVYGAGCIVSHRGRLWRSVRAAGMGEAPGKSDAWVEHRPTADVKDLAAAFGSMVRKADMAGALDPRIGIGI